MDNTFSGDWLASDLLTTSMSVARSMNPSWTATTPTMISRDSSLVRDIVNSFSICSAVSHQREFDLLKIEEANNKKRHLHQVLGQYGHARSGPNGLDSNQGFVLFTPIWGGNAKPRFKVHLAKLDLSA